MSRQPKDIINEPIKDIVKENTVYDLCGDAGESQVFNLKLEDNNDFLLEDGSLILLE